MELTLKAIDPELVVVPADRIRKVFRNEDLIELAESFQRIGQGQPGICLEQDGKVVLVAGERRLKACKLIKMPFCYRLAHTVDPDDIRELEIDENLVRVNFTWQEEVAARQEKHEILERRKAKRGGKQTVRDTAKALNESIGGTQEILEVALFMKDFPEVREAKNLGEAKKVVKKLKGIALREHFFSQATDQAHESKARIETAPEKDALTVEPGEEMISLGKIKMAKDKLLDIDRRIICGTMEEQLENFKDESIQVVVWDPPWGVNYNLVKIENSTQENFEDSPEQLVANLPTWLKILSRKMAKDSHLYMFFGIRHYQFIYQTLTDAGFVVNGLPIYWVKLGVHYTRNPEIWPGRAIEPIAFARKGNKKIVAPGPDYILSSQANPRMKQHHPAAKHPDVFIDLLKRSLMPGDCVLDPMCGSGLSGVAMRTFEHTCKPDWWLIEKEKHFRDLALENCLLGYTEIVAKNTNNTLPEEKSSAGHQYDHLLEKPSGSGNFKTLTPGTPEWKSYWKSNPSEQDEMLAFARTFNPQN